MPVAGAEGKERISVNNIQDFNSVYHDFIAKASCSELLKGLIEVAFPALRVLLGQPVRSSTPSHACLRKV